VYPDWAHGEIALPGLVCEYKITNSRIDRQTVNFRVEASVASSYESLFMSDTLHALALKIGDPLHVGAIP
jgi:hypothetical protein